MPFNKFDWPVPTTDMTKVNDAPVLRRIQRRLFGLGHQHEHLRLARLVNPARDVFDCTCGHRRIVNRETNEEAEITSSSPQRFLIDASQISK